MRGNNHCLLPAGARHKISTPRYRIRAVAVDPKETAIDWVPVGRPCRRHGADEFHKALGKNSLSIPNTVLKIEISQARPVTSGCKLISLAEKVPEGVSFQNHGADAKLVKQGAPRKRQIFLGALLHRQS